MYVVYCLGYISKDFLCVCPSCVSKVLPLTLIKRFFGSFDKVHGKEINPLNGDPSLQVKFFPLCFLGGLLVRVTLRVRPYFTCLFLGREKQSKNIDGT